MTEPVRTIDRFVEEVKTLSRDRLPSDVLLARLEAAFTQLYSSLGGSPASRFCDTMSETGTVALKCPHCNNDLRVQIGKARSASIERFQRRIPDVISRDVSNERDHEKVYRRLYAMSRDFQLTHSHTGTYDETDPEIERSVSNLGKNGFVAVFGAIEEITAEIEKRASDPASSELVRKLFDILRELSIMEVQVGWEEICINEVLRREFHDCAGEVRRRAEEAIEKVRALVLGSTRAGEDPALPSLSSLPSLRLPDTDNRNF